jgi:ankyrin repeat protein
MGMILCLAELRANVNQAQQNGCTPLIVAAQEGNLDVVRFLVRELGADINQTKINGVTPHGSLHKETADVVAYLVKAGANPTLSLRGAYHCTAADISRARKASAEQTVYLEAKSHCSNVDCSGAGILKCTGCKRARYCGEACQLVHWKAHKADCRRWSAELVVGEGSASK